MKNGILLALVLVVFSAGCIASVPNSAPAPSRDPAAPAPNPPAATSPAPKTQSQPAFAIVATRVATPSPAPLPAKSNPFGILVNLNSPAMLKTVQEIGVVYFRTVDALIADKWNGSCPQCEAAQRIGLKLFLTVRANGGGVHDATAPPKDLPAFQKSLGNILDATRPIILAVENEENSTLFYTGTPQEYAAELKAACDVAHSKGIKCTNGGTVSGLVVLMVWADYFEKGKVQEACMFAMRAKLGLPKPEYADLLCKTKSLDQLPVDLKESIAKGKALIQVYENSSMDYMNFHWYIPDAQALEEAIMYLKNVTGKPLLSNEMGQHDESPATVTALLNKSLELGLPYAIWFSADALNAKSLMNSDGALRANGIAFKEFLQTRFK